MDSYQKKRAGARCSESESGGSFRRPGPVRREVNDPLVTRQSALTRLDLLSFSASVLVNLEEKKRLGESMCNARLNFRKIQS